MAGIETNLQVQRTFMQDDCLHNRAGNSLIYFNNSIDGFRQSEFVPVVQARALNSSIFEKPPQTSCGHTGAAIENE